jgi:hypothetical protein
MKLDIKPETTLELMGPNGIEQATVSTLAKRMNISDGLAVQTAHAWLKSGALIAETHITLKLVPETDAPATVKPPVVRRQRRPRAVSTALQIAGAASESQDQSVTVLPKPEAPKKSAAALDSELTWDARVRSHVLMQQPWSEDWPPMATCPPEILQRYGVAA